MPFLLDSKLKNVLKSLIARAYREKDLPPTGIGRIGRRISYGYWSYREKDLPPTGIGRIGRRISLLQVKNRYWRKTRAY